MKWFKMDSGYMIDDKVYSLSDKEFRVWMLLIALVAEKYEGNVNKEIIIYDSLFCRLCGVYRKKLHQILDKLATKFDISLVKVPSNIDAITDKTDCKLIVHYPKFLKKQQKYFASVSGKFKKPDAYIEEEEEEEDNNIKKLNTISFVPNDKNRSEPKQDKITFDFEKKIYEKITEEKIALWQEAYPAVDINAELNKSAAWLIENPKNKKSNYGRFITNWLSRAQDRAVRFIR